MEPHESARMTPLLALLAVVVIAASGWAAALQPGLRVVVAIVLPGACATILLAGIAWRVIAWAQSPVPFRIPLTAGQQASFRWVKPARLDNPATTAGVIGRMALEVLLFRSLARNVKTDTGPSGRLVFREAVAFWLAALAFHYGLLIVVFRHLRLVTQPVPALVTGIAAVDSFFQIGVPAVYLSDALLLAGLGYLIARRLREPQLRYLSLFADYFVVFLLLGVATTGVLMRHFVRVDVVAVKEMAMSLVTLSSPRIAPSLHPLVFAHIALVSVLAACLPCTKLVHMAGVFLSPTRNLANNSRAVRHVNPWNTPATVHTYDEWEHEFRDKLIAAGLPLDGSADRV